MHKIISTNNQDIKINNIEAYMRKLILILVCLLFSLTGSATGVDVKYNGKLCKMEVFCINNVNRRNISKLIAQNIQDFCKNKYVYNIDSVVIHSTLVFTVFYNNKSEVANED